MIRRESLLISAALCLATPPMALVGQDGPANGALVETRSWEIPDSLSVVRILFVGTRIIVISNTPEVVTVLDSMLSIEQVVRMPENTRIGTATLLPDGALQFLTFNPPMLIKAGGDSVALDRPPFMIAGEVLDAVYVPPYGWFAAWQDKSGTVHLTGEDRGPFGVIPDALFDDGAPRSLRLSTGKGSILVTGVHPPHRAMRIPLEGRAATFLFKPLELRDQLLSSSGGVDTRTNVSMPLIQIAGGFLQTITDLSSDDRVIVLFDESGRVVSRRMLSVPMSLTAADTSGRWVVGARRQAALHLVLYEWRLRNAAPK